MTRTDDISVELDKEASLAGLASEGLASGWIRFSRPTRPTPGKPQKRPRTVQTAVNIENLAMRAYTHDPRIFDPAVTSEPGVAYAEVDDALDGPMRVDLNGSDPFTRKVVAAAAARLEALARAQRDADQAQATETLRPVVDAARGRVEAGETLEASLEDVVFGQLPSVHVRDDGRIRVAVGSVAPGPGNFSLVEGDERATDEFIEVWAGDR